MTDRQFNILAQYEDNLRTATTSTWARHPGRSAIQVIYKTLTEIAGPQPRLQAFCQPCVLRVLRNAGKLYFEEKERRAEIAREKAIDEALKKEEKKAPKTATKTADKKTPAKKPKAAKIVS